MKEYVHLSGVQIGNIMSIGLFIPAALQYVRELSPASMQSTAVALYATAGGGFGTWFCTFLGGILMDRFGVQNVYLFFSALTFGGVILFMLQPRKRGELFQEEST